MLHSLKSFWHCSRVIFLLVCYRKMLRRCAQLSNDNATRLDRKLLNQLTMEEQVGVEDMERVYRIFHVKFSELRKDCRHLKKVLEI